jgi:signal transduction histidine kinase/ligand-binding sensor domain-containing protein
MGHRLTVAVASPLVCISRKEILSVLAFLVILLTITMSCPAVALESKQAVNDFYHTSWTAKDGLPGAVLSLVQTTDGFLWIGGEGGLFRFDGLVIERYTPENGPLLHDTVLNVLLGSPDGGLWIGYNQGGASFLKNGKITNFTENDGLPAGQTRCIARDQDGVIWAAFVGGLARFDGKHWQRIQKDWNYAGKTASSLIVDHKGTIWAASEDRIFLLPRGERLFQDAGLSVKASMLVVAPDNVLWLTEPRENSLGPLRMQAGLLIRSLTKIKVSNWSPIFDHDGGLWIGSWGNGILHFPFPGKLHEGTFSKLSPGAEMFTETEGLSDNHATTFFEDREGNIWIGTNAGLDRLRRRNLSWFPLQPGAHDFSLIPGANGEIFAASAFGETMRLPQGIPAQEAPRNVLLAYRDPDGVIWLNCFDGDGSTFHGTLFQWKDRHLTKLVVPQNLENIQVRAMTKDSAGNLWVSVISKGLYKFRDDVWTHIDIFKDNPTASASAAITDSRDRVWLAFARAKQVAVLSEGTVTSFSTEKDLSIGTVTLLARAGEQIWAGGHLGIAFFQGDKFHTVKADDGSTFADVDRVVATVRDGVWLSTHQGIVHIPEGEVEHVIRDPSYQVKYDTFDQLSDLPDPLQAAGSGYVSAVQGSDGLLWFATRNGVARIDPRKISKNPLPPPVSIRSISADGKQYVLNTSVSLPALTKDLRVEYTGLSLSIPERVHFRYKLEGLDKDWKDAGTRREAFYTKLGPGKYRFRVIASNNDGIWNEEGAILDFSIAPAWYQTNWFMVLSVVTGLFVLWVLYQLRLRQLAHQFNMGLEARVNERTRIARELHDTLLQSLHGLMLRFQAASNLLPTRPDEAKQRLDKAIDQAAQAITEGRDAVHELRSSAAVAPDLALAIGALGKELGSEQTGQFFPDADVQVEGIPRNLDPILRDEVYRIAAEALRNAFRHARARRIEVEIRYDEGQLRVRVRDDGKGIDRKFLGEEQRAGHWGLNGMRERAKAVGGNLAVWSKVESGTEVELTIPASIAYAKSSARPRSWLSGKLVGNREIKS